MELQKLIEDNRVVAIITKQEMMPATGDGGVVFPPTYQDVGSDTPTYNISNLGNGRNACTIDSVPSQINRIEARFVAEEPYRNLVPHVVITAKVINKKAGIEFDKKVDILEAPHRLADATVRFSGKIDQAAKDAFLDFLKGDALPIARLSPMSLLFGAWDSHITGVKIPRVFSARIEAENVHDRTRRGYYLAKLPAAEINLEAGEEGKATTLSNIGLDNAGAKGLDGVVCDGIICREAIANLIVLRDNCRSHKKEDRDLLQRYMLGLMLVAQTMPSGGFFRQGCTLVSKGQPESYIRFADGSTEPFTLTHAEAIEFAQQQAAAFGVISSEKTYDFSPELAKEALKKRKKEAK
jgi:CRISPR-associated protein Csb1